MSGLYSGLIDVSSFGDINRTEDITPYSCQVSIERFVSGVLMTIGAYSHVAAISDCFLCFIGDPIIHYEEIGRILVASTIARLAKNLQD